MSGGEVINLLRELIKAEVLTWQIPLCEYCGEEIKEPQIYCLSCKNEISNQITFYIDGCIEDEEDYKVFPELKAQAKRFSHELNHQGYMYYMLLDLTESENLQKQNSADYNEFLENMRELMKREALSQTRKNALSFGEIGDCLKLAFLSESDFLIAMKNFSVVVQNEKIIKQFPSLKGDETIFPRFDGTIGKIKIPKNYKEPEKIFCITLNGGIDFNDYELTKFFRLKHHIKTKKMFFNDENIVSLWVHEDIFKDLQWDEIPTVPIEDNTHNLTKKGNFGLLGFTKNGDYFHEENPLMYMDN
jgi:hypothetical protein